MSIWKKVIDAFILKMHLQEKYECKECGRHIIPNKNAAKILQGEIDGNSRSYNIRNGNAGSCNTGGWNTGNLNTGNQNAGNWNTGNQNAGDWNTGNGNTGYWNTGSRNTGCENTGNGNTGYWNTGNLNTGNQNTGGQNTGDCNAGGCNTGNWNTGDWNTGDRNTGDWNTSSFNTGCFCVEEHKILFFDKETDMTYKEWFNSDARKIMKRIDFGLTEWVPESSMTEEEKQEYPTYKTTGGYLRTRELADCYSEWWGELDEDERDVIKNIPNFDTEKFRKITGIEVEAHKGGSRMKYKVGDRVRIVEKRTAGMNTSGGMDRWRGKVMTICECNDTDFFYLMEEDGGTWYWYDEMIAGLVESKLTAEEILMTVRELPYDFIHDFLGCCQGYTRGRMLMSIATPRQVIDMCRQWKAEHEKKEPEIETVDICRIIEIFPDGHRRCVHEEDIKPDPELPYGSERLAVEEMLKTYCMEHKGVYRAVHEVISRVKAVN